VIEQVLDTIRRFDMFQTGQRVGVAVSGGADSVCLLRVLVDLAPRWNLHLTVLHLDHQLRGQESETDARFVEQLASASGLSFVLAQADIARMARDCGENLEQAARNERRRFFLEQLRSGLVDRVALGHTRSDQAETVLFRFLRGSGTAGLAGIRPVTDDGIVRPLLNVDRAAIEQFLRDRGIAWREDSSNRSVDFARNRIRHELLPMLQREWNPALPGMLANTADWALEEESYWEPQIEALAHELLTIQPPVVLLRADRLSGLPMAAARRLVRYAIQVVKGDLRTIDFAHVSSILDLARQTEGHGRLQTPGVDVYRSFEWLRLAPPGIDRLENRNFRVAAPVPGRIPLPGSASGVLLEVIENNAPAGPCHSGYNELMDYLDWDRIPGALELRNWRPGDQYRPLGRPAEEKIKLLFQDARIPLWERRAWPVITAGDQIVWTRRFGPAAELAATAGSRRLLRILETPA